MQPRGAQWLPVLSYPQPTDANFYAPSLNEASGDDNPFARASNVVFLFWFHLSSHNSISVVNQNQKPWLLSTSLCPIVTFITLLTVLTLPEESCHRVTGSRFVLLTCISRLTKSFHEDSPLHLQLQYSGDSAYFVQHSSQVYQYLECTRATVCPLRLHIRYLIWITGTYHLVNVTGHRLHDLTSQDVF